MIKRLMSCVVAACVAGMVGLMLHATAAAAAQLDLTADGRGIAAIYVHPSVMEPDHDPAGKSSRDAEAETQRRLLRDSVKDLSQYLGSMSGARIEVLTAAEVPAAKPASEIPVQILIGDLATAAFGPPAKPYPYKQGFRVVAEPKSARLGLIGESDLAVSYAIYEILDRLGCRWYMPGDMGEVIPQIKTIGVEEMDFSSHPGTIYRGIWFADDAYRRRNRHGGLQLSAGHALELSYLTEEEKKNHPEWISVGPDGKPLIPTRFKWSNKELADFLADKIIAQHEANPQPSYSLSPDDGIQFDNSPEDKALDAGDYDESFQTTSITDRLLVFTNRLVGRVTAKHPDVLFGCLAYAQYTRPPLRESVPANFVPQIAPITYSRAHPMNDDRVPDNKDLRYLIEGWGSKSRMTSIYFYAWFLAEPVAPNPMIRKWSHDVPFVLEKGNCRFWQPETTSNFETSLHALYLGCRLAWNPQLKPDDVINEINSRFYGAAAREMAAYWDCVDRIWVDTPEYSGAAWAYLRRWTPENLHKCRGLMNAALASAHTPAEKYRVGLADDSLTLFEQFMRMRYDLAEGRLTALNDLSEAWRKRVVDLAEKYKDNSAFTRVGWAPATYDGSLFNAFFTATYKDATRVAHDYQILTNPPMRRWKYLADPDGKGEAAGFAAANFDDSVWKATDVAAETWSTLGHHSYFGAMWYRADLDLQTPLEPAASGKKVYLWLPSTDGTAKVFVNGKHISFTSPPDAQGQAQTKEEADGFAQPFAFDITAALKTGRNSIAILSKRSKAAFNELGTGGLLGAPIVYREK